MHICRKYYRSICRWKIFNNDKKLDFKQKLNVEMKELKDLESALIYIQEQKKHSSPNIVFDFH